MERIQLTDKTLDYGAFYIYVFDENKTMSFRYMYSTAQLLSCIPSIMEEINKLRLKYGIVTIPIAQIVDKQSLGLDLDKYFEIGRGASYRFRADYVADLEKFTNRYSIGNEWYDIITVLLHIDAIIIITLPGLEVRHPKGIPRLTVTPVNNPLEITIYVKRQMAVSDLAKSIRLNRDVRAGLSKLPRYPKTKITDETMQWGHRIWALKKCQPDNTISYAAAKKQLDLQYEGEIPDRIELRKHYKGFYTALKMHL